METSTAFILSLVVLFVVIIGIILIGIYGFIDEQTSVGFVGRASFDSLMRKRQRQILVAKLVVSLIPISCLVFALSINL